MNYKLCMTEKPSVARDIAKVIGANSRQNGYFEGNGYRVTWAVGHLVGLAEPEAYGFLSQQMTWAEENKERAMDELPLMPDEFKLVVYDRTRDQFEIIKKLIHDPDCEEIINCGDMGPEGHILQWFIRVAAGCDKKVRRFCATSMTEEAIKDAFSHLRPEEEFTNIIKGEYCKKKADWIMGISISRACSIKYNTHLTAGRVQSPTLYFVVKRYLDVQNFKETNYYIAEATAAGEKPFKLSWLKDSVNIFPAEKDGITIKDETGRILDKPTLDKKILSLQGKPGKVTVAEKKKKMTDRPQLYDITELERDANKKYGYSPALTLAAAQSLYETHKVLSYPRTDSRYITNDLVPYMQERIKGIATISEYKDEAEALLSKGLNIDKKIVDDSKVTDHHALIPTEKINGFDLNSLEPTDSEKKNGVRKEVLQNVLKLVLNRMIVAFSSAYTFEQTNVSVQVDVMTFSASGRKPIDLGWKAVQERLSGKESEEEGTDDQIFPELNVGQLLNLRKLEVVAKKTAPPKLHTEATLLTAMENAGATLSNGAILKGKGIGTQATRAEHIKGLFDSGYVELKKGKGSNGSIIPTAKGLALIKVLPPELYSPKITADWEEKIAQIAEGKATEDEFMDEFKAFIVKEVDKVKSAEGSVSFKGERPSYGKCPFCGADVYRYENKEKNNISYYCKDKCGFSVANDSPFIVNRTGKKLTEAQIKQIISKGSVKLECKRKSGDGTYGGIFKIKKSEWNGKPSTGWEFEFADKKKK